ncbi:MAG: hypothetical protein KIT18_15890 [Burkholderiales bacterium]|nr:hypothetical protein [Burkholderiales bacterium]
MERIARLLPCLLLCMAAFAASAQQPLKLEPADEAASDAAWTSFRDGLLKALAARDRQFVLSILDPEVRSGLDGRRGVESFRQAWSLDQDDSPLWRQMQAALVLGGAFVSFENRPTEFCAPYVSVKWPQDMDASAGGAIVAREVPAKSAPSSDAETVAVLSYDIVEVTDWEIPDRAPGNRQKWVRIRVKGADTYVPEEQIRSPIEHTACFVRAGGTWRLIGFGPGGGN